MNTDIFCLMRERVETYIKRLDLNGRFTQITKKFSHLPVEVSGHEDRFRLYFFLLQF